MATVLDHATSVRTNLVNCGCDKCPCQLLTARWRGICKWCQPDDGSPEQHAPEQEFKDAIRPKVRP